MIRVSALYRYPVKGFSPEAINEVFLPENGHFPGDRLFAFENGPSGFDPAHPEHMPKIKFLMLMRNESLAALESHFDGVERVLSLAKGGQVLVEGKVDDEAGRATLEHFLERYLDGALRGPVKLQRAPDGFRFVDSKKGFVSLLNLATLDAIGAAMDIGDLDARRFRGNIHLSGLDAFAENDLVGKTLNFGDVELEVLSRIDRCAATDVNPDTAQRDLGMVSALERLYAHHDCGIYARIKKAGTISPGDFMLIAD